MARISDARGAAATADSLLAADPTAALASWRLEAERFETLAGYATQALRPASGGVALKATGKGEHTASHVFGGQAGLYDIGLGYFDENDGTAAVSVLVNGRTVDHFLFDRDLGSPNATTRTAAVHDITQVALRPGDVITLVGVADRGEPARVDYLDMHRTGDLPHDGLRVEAESFHIVRGYAVQSVTAASAGAVLGVNGNGRASHAFAGPAGVYDVDLGYFDENDGIARLSVRVNGHEVDAFRFDQNLGSPNADARTAAVHTISHLTLAPGDLIELVGKSDGGERARVDYLEFHATATPPAAIPDVIYRAADGELKIRLGDGAGGFGAELATGIHDLRGYGVADLNGDGFADIAGLDQNTLALRTFIGDGSGHFTEKPALAIPADVISLDLGVPTLGDVDGDGDVDVVGRVSYFSVQVFKNDGTGSFSLGPRIEAEGDRSSVHLADTSGDGHPDLYYGNISEQALRALTNDGTGNFDEPSHGYSWADSSPSLAFGDFDGDGDLDWVTTGEEDIGAVYVFRNDAGAGTRSQSLFYRDSDPGSPYPYDAVTGDIDGDGDVDIVASAALYTAGVSSRDTLVLVNDGHGTFTGHFTGQDTGRSKQLVDLDGDGDLDLVGPSTTGVRVHLNDGHGTFTFAGDTANSSTPSDLQVSYFDEPIPDNLLT